MAVTVKKAGDLTTQTTHNSGNYLTVWDGTTLKKMTLSVTFTGVPKVLINTTNASGNDVLKVNGKSTFFGSIQLNGTLAASGGLNVTGNTSFTGDVDAIGSAMYSTTSRAVNGFVGIDTSKNVLGRLQWVGASSWSLNSATGTSQISGTVSSFNVTVPSYFNAYIETTGYVKASTYFDSSNNTLLGTRKTGWGSPTGTATRTTFATSSVTLPQLAERLKALIDDLKSHGLIGS